MSSKTHREASREGWNISSDYATREELRTGAQLRMADAMESMAKSKVDLEAEVKRWKGVAACRLSELIYRRRSNAALRGVITKLKAERAQLTRRIARGGRLQ